MEDLCQDSEKTRLACQRNTLPCALSILKHHASAEVCLLGHQWISRGLTLTRYLEKGSVPSYTRSRKIHWTLITQEMREDLQIDFSQQTFFGCFFGTLPWNVSIQNSPPPPKKIDFFSDWVGLFEICFRSSKMIDPRPCPTGWAYFKALSRSTKTCQAQTNKKLSTAKIDIF